jgi:hypothetical protein
VNNLGSKISYKTQSKLLLKPPKNLNQTPSVIKLISIQLQLSTFLLFLHFVRNVKKTNPCAGSAQVITSYPYKNLVEDVKKKKPVNKMGFQSRSWEKNIRNVHRTERKLVYRQKNKPHMEDMTKD